MRRHILGIIAILLLAAGAASWTWPSAGYQGAEAFCLRLGAIVAVLWLAFDDVSRLPAWLLAGVPVLVIILAKWPRYALLVVPVIVVLAILRPRFGARR
jgi:hypothetical protein